MSDTNLKSGWLGEEVRAATAKVDNWSSGMKRENELNQERVAKTPNSGDFHSHSEDSE